MPSTERIRPVLSDHVSGGFYLMPVQGMRLIIVGWYKAMEHLLYYVGPNSMFPPVQNWETSFAEGRGVSYGLETELGWKNEKLSATAYYTLSWSKRFFEEVYPDWFYANNDNRHKLNILFSWRINRALELYANWNYHTGNRVTFPSNVTPEGIYLYSEANNFTLPDYHRLDLGLNWVHRLRKGQRLELNASIYNAYNNKNAFFAYLKRSASGSFDGVAYSVLPFLPSFSLTYGF
ncbi:MAG: hypothetical protein KBS67_01150 [Bacteroidales bacterium]|nr:hypothetical protein [Candidatus Cryptobacteroides equifaecalis]